MEIEVRAKSSRQIILEFLEKKGKASTQEIYDYHSNFNIGVTLDKVRASCATLYSQNKIGKVQKDLWEHLGIKKVEVSKPQKKISEFILEQVEKKGTVSVTELFEEAQRENLSFTFEKLYSNCQNMASTGKINRGTIIKQTYTKLKQKPKKQTSEPTGVLESLQEALGEPVSKPKDENALVFILDGKESLEYILARFEELFNRKASKWYRIITEEYVSVGIL